MKFLQITHNINKIMLNEKNPITSYFHNGAINYFLSNFVNYIAEL